MVSRPFLSIATGSGQLDCAVRRTIRDARAVCYVEHEVTACEVLASRIEDRSLDDAPIWTDLHTFDSSVWRGKVSGIVAGYPCQPFSQAGLQRGADDPRHLWPRILSVINDVQSIDWCVFENVRGHLRLGLREVRNDLRRAGFTTRVGLYTASEIGAVQERARLYIVAWRGNRPELADPVSERGRGWSSWEGDAIHALPTDSPLDGAFPHHPPGAPEFDRWIEILARFPWLGPAVESGVFRMADGLASGMDLTRTARNRLAGNGVHPDCAEHAIRTLLLS